MFSLAQIPESPPYIRARLGAAADTRACAELLWPGDPAEVIRRDLEALWVRCLGRGGFTVVEEANGASRSAAGFGLSVFVRSEFADRYFADPQPHAAMRFYEALKNDEPVLLDERDVAHANAGDGVDVLVLHFGSRYVDFNDSRTLTVLAAGSAGFYFTHGGHRLRSMLFECYGTGARTFLENGQFRLLRDFGADGTTTSPDVPVERRPCLVGLRREWVEPAAVNPLLSLFFSVPPRIGFARTERRILEMALANYSDDDIARSLGVTRDSVKKTWRRILARASALLPWDRSGGSDSTGSRGPEQRRHLLEYVRMHMEELRPYRQAPTSKGSSAAR